MITCCHKPWTSLFVITSLALTVLGSSNGAPNDDLVVLRQRAVLLTQHIARKERALQKTQTALESVSQRIHELKQAQSKDSTLLRRFRLQTLLAQAHGLSQDLAHISKERRELQKQFQINQQVLVAALEKEIEHKRRLAAWSDLKKLLVERNHAWAASAWQPPVWSMFSFLTEDTDDENAQEQLDAIRDLERRVNQEISTLGNQLASAKRQHFLKQELTHLFDEESFFGEQGLVNVGSNKKSASDKEGADLLAKNPTHPSTTDTTNEKSSPQAGSIPANTESSSTVLDDIVGMAKPDSPAPEVSPQSVLPTEPSSSSLEVSTPSGISSPENSGPTEGAPLDMPDPTVDGLGSLDRLEVPHPLEISTVSEPLSRTSLPEASSDLPWDVAAAEHPQETGTSKISWLESRLKKNRQILSILHRKAKTIEDRLAR